jgi:hypothetical protein
MAELGITKTIKNTPNKTTSRRLVKKVNKGGSATDGKAKGKTCTRSEMKDWYCNCKSYKDPKYGEYCQAIDALNK